MPNSTGAPSFLPALPAFAARLGGAYYVDDAEIGKVGSCEIESWSSFATSGDRIAVFSPACVESVAEAKDELAVLEKLKGRRLRKEELEPSLASFVILVGRSATLSSLTFGA